MPKSCSPKNILPSTLIFVGATTMIMGSIQLIPADKHILAQGIQQNSTTIQGDNYTAVLDAQALQVDPLQDNQIVEYSLQQYIINDQTSPQIEQLLPNLATAQGVMYPTDQENSLTVESNINKTINNEIIVEQEEVAEENLIETNPQPDYTSPLLATDTPLFPVTDEQRRLIEIASYMKDVTPFEKNMGPNTSNRYQEWLNADRSIKNPNSVRAYAFLQMGKYGWTVEEWVYLDRLWWHESGWAPTRKDGNTNRAWGIPQALPASKMAKYGEDYLTNPYVQVLWGLDYINSRYGSPSKAWNFWLEKAQNGKSGWY